MARVDFVQLAEYCTERYKGSIEINRGFKYVKTTYFGIFRDNSIHYSSTPHFLHDSHQCILIHEKAISLTYSSYKIEFINFQKYIYSHNSRNIISYCNYASLIGFKNTF